MSYTEKSRSDMARKHCYKSPTPFYLLCQPQNVMISIHLQEVTHNCHVTCNQAWLDYSTVPSTCKIYLGTPSCQWHECLFVAPASCTDCHMKAMQVSSCWWRWMEYNLDCKPSAIQMHSTKTCKKDVNLRPHMEPLFAVYCHLLHVRFGDIFYRVLTMLLLRTCSLN